MEGDGELLGAGDTAHQHHEQAGAGRGHVPRAGPHGEDRGDHEDGERRDCELRRPAVIDERGGADPGEGGDRPLERAAREQRGIGPHDEHRRGRRPRDVREVEQVAEREPEPGGGREERRVEPHLDSLARGRRARGCGRRGDGPADGDDRRPRPARQEHRGQPEPLRHGLVHPQGEGRGQQRRQHACHGPPRRQDDAGVRERDERGDRRHRPVADQASERVEAGERGADGEQPRARGAPRRHPEHRHRQRAERQAHAQAHVDGEQDRHRRERAQRPA